MISYNCWLLRGLSTSFAFDTRVHHCLLILEVNDSWRTKEPTRHKDQRKKHQPAYICKSLVHDLFLTPPKVFTTNRFSIKQNMVVMTPSMFIHNFFQSYVPCEFQLHPPLWNNGIWMLTLAKETMQSFPAIEISNVPKYYLDYLYHLDYLYYFASYYLTPCA